MRAPPPSERSPPPRAPSRGTKPLGIRLARLRARVEPALRVALEALGALVELALPGHCAVCGASRRLGSPRAACTACWAALPRDRARPRGHEPLAAFRYELGVVDLHRRLKFGGDAGLAAPLARRMVIAWSLRAPRPWRRVELVVPVPADPLRLPPRRFATRRIARALARRLGLPLDARALVKRRPTRPQTRRTRRARRHALEGSMRARPERVAGRRVLLVDDVATTGATLAEARRALLEAGAREVRALVLARTPPPGARR